MNAFRNDPITLFILKYKYNSTEGITRCFSSFFWDMRMVISITT